MKAYAEIKMDKKGGSRRVVSPIGVFLFGLIISLLSSCVVYPVGYHHRHWHSDHWEYYR
jgi:hypothetical protein